MKVTAAVVQAGSMVMDKNACIDKAVDLIREAGRQGAQLILLPEGFVPAYPWGLSFGAPVGSRSAEGRQLFERYFANAVEVPSPELDRLCEAAKGAGAFVGMPVIEREGNLGRGTLYCTILYLGPDGSLLGKHRKLKPTAAERVIWGEGDGSTLTSVTTELGTIGGLICWENLMPMARMAMYGKGVEIYLAPTADSRESWQATIRHIACEGRCFVLGCNQYLIKDMYPKDLPCIEDLAGMPEVISRGGSAIVSPFGEYLAGPLFDEEGILTAELDMAEIARGRFDFDVTGHYAKPEVFRLIVDESERKAVVGGSLSDLDQ
jgi:nitrilase